MMTIRPVMSARIVTTPVKMGAGNPPQLNYNKLDAALAVHYAGGAGSTPVNCFVRTASGLDTTQSDTLKNLGVRTDASKQNQQIFTSTIQDWQSLASLTQLPYVQQISLSQKLRRPRQI